jgi:hypothetical protein
MSTLAKIWTSVALVVLLLGLLMPVNTTMAMCHDRRGLDSLGYREPRVSLLRRRSQV